ncbi:hypothetical protein HS1genome_1219 [Sulfodiicoccus acidiphilus]|uniref:Uncharacterized protein n=1 Tax=Sulfodiicoccus acidiphilus TaxID=1670455 RepID=A0A348B3S8_9CREN|nr:hypothetical protein [Sulfodiicoccus acidiphilus]BBD72830.1 hypothetical protein HS1genome_1219 [Sulfodiicoccus acidiphilus]GGT88660.1 hypothetical protein GCM10007116_03320 [Sulfodiicoccus acidiphilus]
MKIVVIAGAVEDGNVELIRLASIPMRSAKEEEKPSIKTRPSFSNLRSMGSHFLSTSKR